MDMDANHSSPSPKKEPVQHDLSPPRNRDGRKPGEVLKPPDIVWKKMKAECQNNVTSIERDMTRIDNIGTTSTGGAYIGGGSGTSGRNSTTNGACGLCGRVLESNEVTRKITRKRVQKMLGTNKETKDYMTAPVPGQNVASYQYVALCAPCFGLARFHVQAEDV